MSDKSFSSSIGQLHPAQFSRQRRARTIAFTIFSIILAIGAFVPCLVNVLQAGRIDWSLYALGAILMSWLIFTPWLVFRQYRAAISWGMTVITVPPYLGLVEALGPAKGWFLPLGLPAAVLGLVALGGLIWLWCYSKIRPWYAIASTALILGILTFLEHAVARPFLFPDPYESIRNMVALSLVGMAIVLGMLASLARGR